MEWFRIRHRENAPTLYLTLTSIMLAIAVENLIGRLDTLGALSGLSRINVLIWLQATASFQSILLIWIVSSQVFHNLRWRVEAADIYLPFSTGVGLLLIIAWMGPDSMLPYFTVGSITGLSTSVALRSVLKSSRLDTENREVLTHFSAVGIQLPGAATAAIWIVAAVLVGVGVENIELMIGLLLASNAFSFIGIASWLRGLRRVLHEPELEAA